MGVAICAANFVDEKSSTKTTFVAVFVDNSQEKVVVPFLLRLNCLQGHCYAMSIQAPAVVLC